MNPFEMTVLIVAIVAVAKVLRAKYRHDRRDDDMGSAGTDRQDQVDVRLMADEVRRLRDRVAVLERIATDGEGPSKLDREIEALRVRDR